MSRHARSEGTAVILALGILAALSALALTMTSVLGIERAASSNYVLGLRARLCAESGIERARAELIDMARRGYATGPDAPWCWDRGDPASAPRLEDAAPARCSVAGSLGATLSRGLDEFRVAAIDAQSRIDVNSGGRALPRVLDALGAALAAPVGPDPLGGRGAAPFPLRASRG